MAALRPGGYPTEPVPSPHGVGQDEQKAGGARTGRSGTASGTALKRAEARAPAPRTAEGPMTQARRAESRPPTAFSIELRPLAKASGERGVHAATTPVRPIALKRAEAHCPRRDGGFPRGGADDGGRPAGARLSEGQGARGSSPLRRIIPSEGAGLSRRPYRMAVPAAARTSRRPSCLDRRSSPRNRPLKPASRRGDDCSGRG